VTRREDRRVAIDVLYQADLTDAAPADVLEAWRGAGRAPSAFSAELVVGVTERLPDIDLLLETHAQGWSVARMTALDRTILRVGVYELLWCDDVPTSVAISEAVEAAAELSADDAKRFVNGVLGRIAREEGLANA
jgi:N utilization substance protein B